MTDGIPKSAVALVAFIQRRPWLCLGLSVVMTLAMAGGGRQLRTDFSHRSFFHESDPLLQDYEKFERRFGNDEYLIIAMHSPSGIFDDDSVALLRELTRRAWLLPNIARVDSLVTYNWISSTAEEVTVEPFLGTERVPDPAWLEHKRSAASSDRVLPSFMVSKDGRTTILYAAVRPDFDNPPDPQKLVSAARELTAELQRSDHEFHILGAPAVTVAFLEAAQNDMTHLMPIVLLLTIIILALALRSAFAVLASLGIVMMSVMATMGMAGHLGIEVSNIVSIIPQILTAIAVADAVHLMNAYRKAVASHRDRKSAVRHALEKNFTPTLATSVTTALGFLTFTTADLLPVWGLGILAAIGIMVAWLLSYFFLGALLFIVPVKPRASRPGATPLDIRLARRLVPALVEKRAAVLVVFAVLVGLSLFSASKTTINSDPFKYFKEGYSLRVANDFMEREVGGSWGVEIVAEAGASEGIKSPAFMRKVDELQSWIGALPHVNRVYSAVDITKQMNEALGDGRPGAYEIPTSSAAVGQQLLLYTMSLPEGMSVNDRITSSNDALRISVFWTLDTSQEFIDYVHRIEAKAEALGLVVHATGKNFLYQVLNEYVVRAFVTSLGSALLLITIALMIIFRSVRLGLLALIPNAVPLIVGAGLLHVIGKPLDIGLMLVSSICLGIAVDDTIHIVSGFKRFNQPGAEPVAVLRSVFEESGNALATTTVVLVAGFSVFLGANFVPNIYFGLMTGVVLIVALVTDFTLLPVLLLGVRGRAASEGSNG